MRSVSRFSILARAVDPDGISLSGAQVFAQVTDPGGAPVIDLQGFADDAGNALLIWKTDRRQAKGLYTATVVDVIKNGYSYDPAASEPIGDLTTDCGKAALVH